jgi:hypothetical protein
MIDNQLQSHADGEQPETEQNGLVPAVQEARMIKYDSACRALAEASAVDEVKEVLDQALKLKLYAKIADNKQLERDAVAIRLQAERRLGEMMAAQAKTIGKAKPPSGKGQHKTDRRVLSQPDGPPTLAEAGIDKNLGHRARKLAELSQKEFDKRVAEMRKGDRGSLDIRRSARSAKRDADRIDDAERQADEVLHRSSFLGRAQQAEACAQYDGRLEPGLAEERAKLARKVADIWNALADRYEQAAHDAKEKAIADEHERG